MSIHIPKPRCSICTTPVRMVVTEKNYEIILTEEAKCVHCERSLCINHREFNNDKDTCAHCHGNHIWKCFDGGCDTRWVKK